MPIYSYRCDHCKEMFDVRHGMFFVQDRCIKCHTSGFLEKIPSISLKPASEETKKKVGAEVKRFIEQTRDDIAKEKERLKKEQI